MAQQLFQLSIVVVFLLSAFGWGRLAGRFLDRRALAFHTLTTITALAVLSAVGGGLNLLRLARPPVLLALLALGVAVTLRELLRRQPWRRRVFPSESIPLLVVPALALGAALLLLPAGLFNLADDFHTYVTRATRMTQTGTLAGNAFDSLGLDSLGSSTFFHSIFLSVSGIESLNGFDAVSCFALCLLLVAELALRWRLPWWLGVIALVGLTWMNPQYVNISPLYAGTAGVMGLTLCGLLLARSLARRPGVPASGLALSVGLLAAWLVTMKVTLGFFAGIFLAILLILVTARTANRLALLKTAGVATLAFAAGVLPWALVAFPELLRARNVGERLMTGASLADTYTTLAAHEAALLFRPLRLFYGDTPVLYLGIAGLALALGLAGLAQWFRQTDRRLSGMPALAAAGVAMFLTMLLDGHLFPLGTAVRYACPVLIGGFFVVALGYLHARTLVNSPARRWLGAALAAAISFIIVLFNDTFVGRLETAMRYGTLLAYRVDLNYAAHCQHMLTREEAEYHRQLQTNLTGGATVLVWTATPFHFDFERNRLLTLTVPGLCSPALRFPAGLPPDGFERYLRNNGVQYVVLEKKGYAVVELADLARTKRSQHAIYQKLADFGTYFRTNLDELALHSRVINSDERMLIFELGQGRPLAPPEPAVTALTPLSP